LTAQGDPAGHDEPDDVILADLEAAVLEVAFVKR